MFRTWSATKIVVLAVLTALIAVLTLMVRVPIAPTRGYIHLGDAGVFFASFAFGPAIGFLAGGLGTGLADLLGGYAHWAPLSFIIHGLQGLLAGYIGYRQIAGKQALGWFAGSVVMIAGYFLAEVVLYGAGAAIVEVPGNTIQCVAGGLVAIPLAAAIRKAWPPIDALGTTRAWEER
ncbi:MAG: ECF transporter S component [Anaerolineae bacterium]